MIGKKLSPLLVEIESTLFEFEVNRADQPKYTDDGFRAAVKIFMSAFIDKIYDLQENENLSLDDRLNMVNSAGNEFRNLIKTYCNIDTHRIYDNYVFK